MSERDVAPGMTCSMSAQADEVLAAYARRMGAWRVWLLRMDVEDLLREMGEAAGVPVEVGPALGGLPLCVPDLRSRSRETWGKALFVVDASLATSALCAPIKLGAPVCVESLDMTLGREGTGLVVVGVGRKCRWRAGVSECLDGLAATREHAPRLWDPALVAGRLDGLDERVRAASDVAQEVATYLSCHPRVAAVRYPGLRVDPSYENAASDLHHGFGPLVDYRAHGAGEWRRLSCLGPDGPRDVAEVVLGLEEELRP